MRGPIINAATNALTPTNYPNLHN